MAAYEGLCLGSSKELAVSGMSTVRSYSVVLAGRNGHH